MGAVDVGDEVRSEGTLAPAFACLSPAPLIGLERLADHQRAEVGAADADVDEVGDGLAAVAAPGAAPDLLAEGAHAREHAVDRRHDVLAVDQDRPVRAVAERDVQDGRSSVMLIRSPANMRARKPSRSTARARSKSSRIVSPLIRFFE